MKHYICLLTALILTSSGTRISYSAEAGRPVPNGALTPTSTTDDSFNAAIMQLGEEDFGVRNKAIESVKASLSNQAIMMASVKGCETQASILPVLAYNDGLLRWLQEVWLQEAFSLPPEQRRSQLELACSSEVLRTLSSLFDDQVDVRLAGVHELAKFSKLEMDALLARLIADSDRKVSLAAMEVAWSRKPTPLTVEALWHKAIEAKELEAERRRLPRTTTLTFRGQPIMDFGLNLTLPEYDDDIATDVLIHTKATAISTKLAKFLTQCITPGEQKNSLSLHPSLRNALQLAQDMKVRETAPSLYAFATQERRQRFVLKDKSFRSNVTTAIVAFLIVTDQPHDAYTDKTPQEPDGNAIAGRKSLWTTIDETTEEKSVEDIKGWWKKHSKEFGAG